MVAKARLLSLALLLIAGCRGRIDSGPGDVPLSAFSANISAGDLLDARTAGSRLSRYLDELTEAGYKKQVRIILPPDWGPIIHQHWFPVLRARGFKVLAILGQEKRDSAADAPAAIAWVKHILPLVRADLVGIQIVNEPAYWFTPAEYAAYHRRIAPLVRDLAPGVPIVAGDFGAQLQGRNTLDIWQATLAGGDIDYDVVSIHPTGNKRRGELLAFAKRLREFLSRDGASKKVWITEGDWGHLPFLRGQGLDIEEAFIYTWNDDADAKLIRRPGGRLP
ncbi:MAG: hypothetical protein FJ271_08500 [Planctomycetes bacterium]|nr:hypothetical protein [Planctomycetota bacterium]